jgi:hypothetical protein
VIARAGSVNGKAKIWWIKEIDLLRASSEGYLFLIETLIPAKHIASQS